MSENKYFDSDNFENTDNSVEYEDMQSFEETYERSAEEPSEHTFEENRTDPFEGALERDFADPAQAVFFDIQRFKLHPECVKPPACTLVLP